MFATILTYTYRKYKRKENIIEGLLFHLNLIFPTIFRILFDNKNIFIIINHIFS